MSATTGPTRLLIALLVLLGVCSQVAAHPAHRQVARAEITAAPTPTATCRPIGCIPRPCPPGVDCGCPCEAVKPPPSNTSPPAITTETFACAQTICGPCSPGSVPTSTVPPGMCPICGCSATSKPVTTTNIVKPTPPPVVPTPIPDPPCPLTVCGPCSSGSIPTSTVPPGMCPICGCSATSTPITTTTNAVKPTPPPAITTTVHEPVCPHTICGPCSSGSVPTSTVPPGMCPICGCSATPTNTPYPTSTSASTTRYWTAPEPATTWSVTEDSTVTTRTGSIHTDASTRILIPRNRATGAPSIPSLPPCLQNPCIATLCPVGTIPTVAPPSSPGNCATCQCTLPATSAITHIELTTTCLDGSSTTASPTSTATPTTATTTSICLTACPIACPSGWTFVCPCTCLPPPSGITSTANPPPPPPTTTAIGAKRREWNEVNDRREDAVTRSVVITNPAITRTLTTTSVGGITPPSWRGKIVPTDVARQDVNKRGPKAPLGAQCGGLTYKGPTECEQRIPGELIKCVVEDPYMHVCEIIHPRPTLTSPPDPRDPTASPTRSTTLSCSASCKIKCPPGSTLTGSTCPFCECWAVHSPTQTANA